MLEDQGHVKLLGQHRRGETLVVACHDVVDYLSHGTVLEDCTIDVRGAARGIIFHEAALRRCAVHARRPFKNYSWHSVRLEGCTFRGNYVGCDFGPRPDAYPRHKLGAVSGCDFEATNLHQCRFFNVRMQDIRLPRWPCFTVLEPAANAGDWQQIPLPPGLGIIQRSVNRSLPGEVARVYSADELERTGEATADALRPLLAGKPYIVL